MRLLATVFCLCFMSFTYSQEAPPTLSFGLDKVLFGKGVIDVDLLTDIIAEKQDELKSRIIEQHILEPVFKNTSFATKNYVFSVVRDLLHEKDKNVLKKQVMEQTVNYAVIYAIAELYVANSHPDSLRKMVCLQDVEYKKFDDEVTSSLFTTRKWDLPWINGIDVRRNRQKSFLDEGTNKISIKKVKEGTSKCLFGLKEEKVDSVAFNDLLMDCILQAVISNEKLKNKGFLNKAFYFNLEQFESMSYYHRFKDDPESITSNLYTDVRMFVDNIADLYESFEMLEKYLLDPTIDKTTFDVTSFGYKIENRMSDLLSDIGKYNRKIAKELVEQIRADSTDIDFLKITKSKYTRLVDEINSKYALDDPSKYFKNPEVLKAELTKLKELYSKDRELLMYAKSDKSFDTLRHLQCSEISFELKDTLNPEVKIQEVKELYERMGEKVKLLPEYIKNASDYIGLIFSDSTLASKTLKMDTLKEQAVEALKASYQLRNVNMLDLNDLLDELQLELFRVADVAELELSSLQDSIIADLFKSFYFLKYNQAKALNLSYIAYLHTDVLPKVQMLNIKSKGNLTNTAMLIEQIAVLMEYKIVQSMLVSLKKLESSQFESIFNRKDRKLALSFFLKFFEHLDRLDEIDTYYYLLEQIKMAGEQCDNRDVANAISLITQSVEKYSKFVPDEERIDFDVELIIGALYDRYGNRDKNPLNFHLTLGLNNAFALNSSALVNVEGDSIRNLGYASEKIGIRLNIWNFEMRHTYLDGEKKPRSVKEYNNAKYNYDREPLISNIHWMLYGSGFLYQLADAGTSKGIQSTFIGSGFGATFYNNLNFNISYMLPIKYDGSTKFNNAAINVGFDIYFGEYLTALNKKRKENKKLKLAAKYANNKEQLTVTELEVAPQLR